MHYADAIRVFDAVRRSDYRLITSPLAIAETIGVTRKRTATSYRCRPGHGEDLRHVDDMVREAVARAIRLLDNLSRQGFLIILDIPGWPFDLSRVYYKMLEHPGRTVPWHGKSCRHLGIDSCDWPHMALPWTPARRPYARRMRRLPTLPATTPSSAISRYS